jgi:hypothetical protein
MYFSYLMLCNLMPGTATAAEQRVADEQLGQAAAALARARHRIAERAHVMTALPARSGHPPKGFRNSGSGRCEPDLVTRR